MCAALISRSHMPMPRVLASALAERDGGSAALVALRAAGFDVASGLPGAQVAERAGGCFDGAVALLALSEALAATGDAVAALRHGGARIAFGVAGVLHDSAEEHAALGRGADFIYGKASAPELVVARLAVVLLRQDRAAPAGMAEVQAAFVHDAVVEIELDPGLFFHPRTRRVRQADGAEVALTRSEAALLALLAARPEMAVTREAIATEILGRAWSYTDRSVDNAVSSLRRKLGFNRDFGPIRTVRNQGYRLVPRRAR